MFQKISKMQKNMGGDQSPFWRQHKAQLDHMECKGWCILSTIMGWNICKVFLHAPNMIKQKFQETSTFDMIKHSLRELRNWFWKHKFKIVCNKEFWFSFRIHSIKFLFIVASNIICWSRCGLVGKFQNVHNCLSTPSSLRQSTQPLHHKKTNRWWNLNQCCWSNSCLQFSCFDFKTINLVATSWNGIIGRRSWWS
jgi:hypothetical protein